MVNCAKCNKKIGLKEKMQLKAVKQSLRALEKMGGSAQILAPKKYRQMNDYAGEDTRKKIQDLVEKGWCARCITEECGEEF